MPCVRRSVWPHPNRAAESEWTTKIERMDITHRSTRTVSPRSRLIKIRVTPFEALRVFAAATAESATVSEFVRRVVTDYLDAREREKAAA